MGVELLEIGVKLRKLMILTVRGCYRSVCNHPFLMGMLCFLILLYRSCPLVFSLLVSASPVLVCTAVLLGTLLSFGQPNIPEIEIEEKTSYEAVSLKTGVSGDVNGTVIEKNESCYVERYSENELDEPERVDSSYGKEINREVGLDDSAPLIEERSREVELDGGDLMFEHKHEWNEERCEHEYASVPKVGLDDTAPLIEERSREVELDGGDLRFERKDEWNEEIREHEYASVPNVDDDEHLELDDNDDEKAETESFDSETVNVDSLDSPPCSPWKRIEEREEEDDVSESESESDRAESSSPDASMADIMPMLDELHPLLDKDTPRPVPMSRDGSPRSRSDGHDESDDGSENPDNLDDPDDDNDDNEDEEGDKEEHTKCAITWTEEDQKNLMDLGSSEIERNIRLENLINRRRARKNMSVIPERNLIDFEISTEKFNIAPITTRRQNPFDSPRGAYDDDDNSDLPPVPGSAPSILLPRRNPFDIPYDSSEEKPDLMGDGFQEEFTRNQSRDSFFRRHESFYVRPSIFARNRRDVKMRPFFVPEGTVSEESSYSSFQRQSSELSDYSKVSSVPETESIGSVEDLEETKLDGEHNQQELEIGLEMKGESEVGPSRDVGPYLDVGPSQGVGPFLDVGPSRDVGPLEEGNVSNFGGVEQRYRSDSSSSSLSEMSERVFTVTEIDEDLSVLDERLNFVAEEPVITAQTSIESIDPSTASTSVNEVQHIEPVYDLSPRELTKNFSSSSISSDLLVESSTVDLDEHESRLLDVALKSSLEDSLVENVDENVQVSEPPFEGQLIEEYSVDINKRPQSPNSDADFDNESNEKLISSSSVEVSSASVEASEDVGIQKIDMSAIYDLNHDISSNINSPFIPDLISVPSTSFETTTSHVDVQTTVEEVDEITEIDEDLLSELDNVGDFSIFSSNVSEKRDDSIELNEIENKNGTVSEESGSRPVYPVISRDYEHTVFGMAEVEGRTVEEIDSGFKQISDKEIEGHGSIEPPQSELASLTGPVHEASILELGPIEEVSCNEKEVNSVDHILHAVELGESQGISLESRVEDSVSDESTLLPPANVIDGKMEEGLKPTFDDVSLETSAIASRETEHKVEAQGTSSELFVEGNEITDLPLEEVVDGVKPNYHNVLEESKKDREISVVVFEQTEQKVEQQGISSELLVDESTYLPSKEVLDDSKKDQLNTNCSLEIKKDEEITFEQKVEAQGISSELLVEEAVPCEITNLALEEAIDGNTEKHVKLISEIRNDKEIGAIAFDHPELKVQAQGTSLESNLEEPVSIEITNLPPLEVKHSDDDQSVEIEKDEQIIAVGSENAELKGDSSESLAVGPLSEESSKLPLQEDVDGDTEKPKSKDEEFSAVAFENPEHVKEPSNGKPNSDDLSVEMKKDDEKPQKNFEGKGKGKLSRSSSSSSSSSSESSSDSE